MDITEKAEKERHWDNEQRRRLEEHQKRVRDQAVEELSRAAPVDGFTEDSFNRFLGLDSKAGSEDSAPQDASEAAYARRLRQVIESDGIKALHKPGAR